MSENYHIECDRRNRPVVRSGKPHPQVREWGIPLVSCIDYMAAETSIEMLKGGSTIEEVRAWNAMREDHIRAMYAEKEESQ